MTRFVLSCLMLVIAGLTAFGVTDLHGAPSFSAELKNVVDGKVSVDTVTLEGRDASGAFVLYGAADVGFIADTQIRLTAKDIKVVLQHISDAGFTGMPDSFGGRPQPKDGPRPLYAIRLIRSLSVYIGTVSKSVNQIDGGAQSKELESLITDIAAALTPRKKNGLALHELTLQAGLAKMAAGELAPEALTVGFTVSPRNAGDAPTTVLTIHQATVTINGKPVTMSRAAVNTLCQELGGKLTQIGAKGFPLQLYDEKALIGVSFSLTGIEQQVNISADIYPYNVERATANPDAQRNFVTLKQYLQKVLKDLSPNAP